MEEKLYQTNYSIAVHWCHNALILCNEIVNIDPSVYDNIEWPDSEESEEEREAHEIYMWFLTDCNRFDKEYLQSHFPGLIFSYSEKLALWVLCVDHYGTGWDYVTWVTTNPLAEAKLGQRMEDLFKK